jgi:hypothetical protein
MRILRKTAEKIAAAVVRYASAGSKEWAEAIASELAYIESDWRALAWALSGMRVLLSYYGLSEISMLPRRSTPIAGCMPSTIPGSVETCYGWCGCSMP